MHNLEMLSWHILMYMLCSIITCIFMPYICPVEYLCIAMNMPICCSSFLLTSWYLVVSLLLSDPCLFWSFSNYLFWSMLWLLSSHAMFANFGDHMPLFHACKYAIIMLLFYTCWNCFNIQSCHVGSHLSMSHMYMMPGCYFLFVMCNLMPCPWLLCLLAIACLFLALNLPSY